MGSYQGVDNMEEYVLDYNSNTFILWHKNSRQEHNISDVEAIDWSGRKGVYVTKNAESTLDTIAENMACAAFDDYYLSKK